MRRYAPLLVALALLGGCNRGVELTDASMQDVAKALGDAARQEPGQWRTVTELEAMNLGKAANPRTSAAIKQQIGQQQVASGCLSPAQAGAPGFGQLRGGSCRFDRFVLKGGQLEAIMHCARPDARLSVTQKGSYSATAYDVHSTLRQEGPKRPAESMTMHIVGRRTGECAK